MEGEHATARVTDRADDEIGVERGHDDAMPRRLSADDDARPAGERQVATPGQRRLENVAHRFEERAPPERLAGGVVHR